MGMKSPQLALIYSTHPTRAQAQKTARALLDETLAACCNIVAGIESHYLWKGKRAKANEVLMLTKTSAKNAKAAMQRIKALHPYETPAILKLSEVDAEAAFARWLRQNCI